MNLLGMLGAASAFCGVAAGAFGAHALRSRLSPEMLAVFETAVRYQMLHALGLLVAALLPPARSSPDPSLVAGWLFVSGTILFSGSLYALALTGLKPLGAITPLGGLCFLAGWGALAYRFAAR